MKKNHKSLSTGSSRKKSRLGPKPKKRRRNILK